MRNVAIGTVLTLTLVSTACSGPAPQPVAETATPAAAPAAPPAPAFTPIVSLNEIMVSVIDPHSHEVWEAEQKVPATAADWTRLEEAAVVLATAGGLTAVSGNGPKDQQWTAQGDWVKHSNALSAAGLATLQAVRAKDREGVRKGGDALVLTCINCHREYKLDVPKIWADHEGVH